jgi:DNA modification methylase
MESPPIRLGTYAKALADQRRTIDLIFTSPPYNIGSKSPRIDGRRKDGGYDPKSYGGITGYADNLPEDKYQDSQVAFLKWCADALKDDGVLVYNHKPRRKDGSMIHPLQWILRVPQLVLMEEIIWDRGSTHNHANRLFWPTTERLYVLRKADGSYRFLNTDRLEFRDDHWEIPLCSRTAGAKGHACPFSDRLTANVIKAFTKPGDLVCDPYTGSGTTAVVATAMDRQFVGAERDARYAAQAVARLQALQGVMA